MRKVWPDIVAGSNRTMDDNALLLFPLRAVSGGKASDAPQYRVPPRLLVRSGVPEPRGAMRLAGPGHSLDNKPRRHGHRNSLPSTILASKSDPVQATRLFALPRMPV